MVNFQFYLEKLLSSDEFKKFKEQNKDCYLCSGFFSIDKKGGDSQQHLDFYLPSTNKVFSFQLEKSLNPFQLEDYGNNTPEEIDIHLDFYFSEIERNILNRMKDEKIDKKIEKLLFSLQKLKGKNFLIGTIFISGMGILKVTIDLDEKSIVDFEKKSFFDMMKIIKK